MIRRTKREVKLELSDLSEPSSAATLPSSSSSSHAIRTALARCLEDSALAIDDTLSSATDDVFCLLSFFLTFVPHLFSTCASSFKKSCGSIYTHNPRARNTTGRLLSLAQGTSN